MNFAFVETGDFDDLTRRRVACDDENAVAGDAQRAGDERFGLLLASLPATRTWERADQTLLDLYASEVGVAILTLGQYLRPSPHHLPVEKYYHPDEFAELAGVGRELGFSHVESGPLVRSSYHAKRQAEAGGT